METNDPEFLLAHLRNEVIYWGSAAVAVMDHLELDSYNKFYHLVVNGAVKGLLNDIGRREQIVPKEMKDIINEGDQEKMRQAMVDAIEKYEGASREYHAQKEQMEYRQRAVQSR